MLRRTNAAGDSRQTTDECVPGRRNELELLTDKWERASTPQEKYLLAGDIQGVLNDLRRRRVTPPLPPWATGPGAVRTSLEVGRPGPDLSAGAARELAGRFADAEQALTRLRDDKKASAKKAGKEAREAAEEARKARDQKDSGAALRADTAEADARSHRNRQGRHIRIAAAYDAALNEAAEARKAYERYARVRAAAPHAPAPTQPGQMSMAATAAAGLGEAGRAHDRYLEALAKALPDPFSMPEAMPTGRLAHLNVLTDRVNDALKEKGAPRRYTPDELENYIRADFHKVVSGDGLVLSTGWGKNAAEVRIRLSLSDLVEMIDPGVVASQATVGMFYQTGQTYSATKSGGTGTTVDLSSAPFTPLLQVGSTPRLLAEMFAVGAGASHGRSWSASSGSSMFEQGGSVADNRSESLLFDAKATWSVEVRTRKSNGWSAPVLVSSGDPGDTTTQRIWVWHSYVDQESRRTTTIEQVEQTLKVTNPEATRKRPASNQEVIAMTGLEAAFDKLARELGGEFARIGTNARRDLRKFVTQEVQARFGKTHTGLSAILAVNGEPDVRITATSRLVPEKTRMVGAATADVLEEGFSPRPPPRRPRSSTADRWAARPPSGSTTTCCRAWTSSAPSATTIPTWSGPSSRGAGRCRGRRRPRPARWRCTRRWTSGPGSRRPTTRRPSSPSRWSGRARSQWSWGRSRRSCWFACRCWTPSTPATPCPWTRSSWRTASRSWTPTATSS
ncbi:hypothetical protein ACFQ0B_45850 [Nonomuraea thailandensis]